MSRFLRISEFADCIGVTSVTLREWERRGILKPHHRTPSGYRYYTEEQADEFFKSSYTGGRSSDRGGEI